MESFVGISYFNTLVLSLNFCNARFHNPAYEQKNYLQNKSISEL